MKIYPFTYRVFAFIEWCYFFIHTYIKLPAIAPTLKITYDTPSGRYSYNTRFFSNRLHMNPPQSVSIFISLLVSFVFLWNYFPMETSQHVLVSGYAVKKTNAKMESVPRIFPIWSQHTINWWLTLMYVYVANRYREVMFEVHYLI